MSAHVVHAGVEGGGSKGTSRQSSFQTAVTSDSAGLDEQTLNLKHLSEAITTLTSPPVSRNPQILQVMSQPSLAVSSL